MTCAMSCPLLCQNTSPGMGHQVRSFVAGVVASPTDLTMVTSQSSNWPGNAGIVKVWALTVDFRHSPSS